MANEKHNGIYMKNKKYNSFDDILIISAVAFMSVFIIITDIKNNITDILKIAIGIVMILFIPGYLMINTIFPKNKDLNSVERLVLSLGLSIATVSLIGLLTNFILGIKLVSVLVSLYIYFIPMIIICVYRRKNLPEDVRYSVSIRDLIDSIIDVRLTDKMNNRNKTIDRILAIILIITVISFIYMVYGVVTVHKIGERFTEFYILNSDGHDLNVNNMTSVRIGISNYEYARTSYTININSDKGVLLSQDIILDHGQTWEQDIYKIDESYKDKKLEFLLFKEKNFIEPYRKLYLWVN